MDIGKFYFINDDYFKEYMSSDGKRNKPSDKNGNAHNRPYLCVAKDNDINWMVPISSQTDKYRKLYQQKTANGKSCDTIDFAYVKGNEDAVLIQDMIPVTDKYISNQYNISDTGSPVTISNKAQKRIVAKSRKAIRMAQAGKAITLTPIMKLKEKLSNKK